jgi:hypothetical protein
VETDLVVFAHRITEGKYRGKTSLIIYGLKAYIEHSDLIQRERERFAAFEKGLQEGAVIEQLLVAEPATTVPARAFEPVIHAGSGSAREIYDPLLGNLLELRRYSLRESWGFPQSEVDRKNAAVLRDRLAAQGTVLPAGNPLVGIDPFSSSFIYRRRVNGQEQEVKVTRIPSLEDIDAALRKAEDAQLVEEARRDAAAGKSAGVALINQALDINGHLEVGPLLRNQDGQVLGVGLIRGPHALEDLLALIERLPVVDRARLRFNHYSATVVELDIDGDGVSERVFLTIEFPLGEMSREWTNPLSGERETLLFAQGQWRKSVTDRRILEFDYDAENTEIGSRTYANWGNRQTALKGELIEETRTLELWHTDLGQPGVDPYEPVVSKLRINYVTGTLAREIYGLFPLPIELADDQYVTRNHYNSFGLFDWAGVHENGQSEADFQRPAVERVLKPIVGRERFHLTYQLPDLAGLRDLSASGYQTVVERADLIKGVVKIETIDGAHSGRKTSETFVDPFDGARSFTNTLTLEYEEDFHYGLIPIRTRTTSGATDAQVSETTALGYNPLRRRLTATAIDSTGALSTNTWDYRWSNPVEVETPQRRTVVQYNHDETAAAGETTTRSTGELLQDYAGQYDASRKVFQMTRRFWYRPGIPRWAETNTYSAFGRLIATRINDAFEVRPNYSADGIELSRDTFRRDSATGRFTIPHRREEAYRWQNGGRNAHVRTWLEGVPHDDYDKVTDSEGRTIVDGIRQWPQLDLRTVITYDGESERVLEAEVRQNGEVRATHRTLGEVRQSDGSYRLLVAVIPTWGLTQTNSFRLEDPVGRPVSIEIENGERANGVAWFADTPVTRVAETSDRHGRVIKRVVMRPNAGTDGGFPFDQFISFAISPWSDEGRSDDTAVVRGTDVSLFEAKPEGRVYFDLAKPYQASHWAMDPCGNRGISVIVAGTARSNVTAVFKSALRNWQATGDPTRPVELVMELEGVDLLGLFYHKVSRRVSDRAGKVVEEQIGKIANLAPNPYTQEAILSKAAVATMIRKFSYQYERGWLSEQVEPVTGLKEMIFTTNRPAPQARSWSVNELAWLEWPTQIDGRQATIQNQLKLAGSGEYLFRRVHDPRVLQQNPYLPGVTNCWTAWTTTELNERGEPLFDGETVLDGQGSISASDVQKVNSHGRPAGRITYQLPLPAAETWRSSVTPTGSGGLQLTLAGPGDLSPFDFVAFYLDTPTSLLVRLRARDSAGNTVFVSNGPIANNHVGPSFWPIESGQVQWLPNKFFPDRGSVVVAPATAVCGGNAFAVSVPELAREGLDVRRLSTIELSVGLPAGEVVRVSPLYRLAHRGAPLAPEQPRRPPSHAQPHASGLETFAPAESRRANPEGSVSPLRYNGLTVGTVSLHPQPPHYPKVHLADNADPDSPAPLYALAAEDGRFLEYYRTLDGGDRTVFSAVSGFESPKLEVFRARVLDDELSPGVLVFGQGYPLAISLSKGHGALSSAIASLQNRCAASIFTLGGERSLHLVFGVSPKHAEFLRLSEAMGPAASQAAVIDELPMLASALMSRREVPWKQAVPDVGAVALPTFNQKAARVHLLRQVMASYSSNTELIPTSPGTAAERFVDTAQEGSIIELAVKLNEPWLARELLAFYSDKSQGGTKLLHSTYDGKTGASLTKVPKYERPSDAPKAAEAQLAIAQAAFCLGMASGDASALGFGRNLLNLLLNEFRPAMEDVGWPRGITERPARSMTNWHGLTLWPEAKTYSLKSNARAYLLLNRLSGNLERYPFDPSWKQRVVNAAAEQAAWLTNHIVPQLLRTGVAPKGLFEIQDVHGKTQALASERWTSADDWLAFIEAVDQIGISKELSRAWLENLARAHGVSVDGLWGLDWSVALQRSDAISSELTARFARVARQVGHQQAADFAENNLARLYRTQWPVVATTGSTSALLPTGQGSWIHPATATRVRPGQTNALAGWAETLGVEAELTGQAWPTNLVRGSGLKLSPVQAGDITQFFWIAAGFYLAIVAVTLLWWLLSAARKRQRAKIVAGKSSSLLVSDRVMEKAEERWAKRVLGLRLPANAERSRYSNVAVEQNFHMQLRATYKLVLEWRRMVNGWSEDDSRLVEDGTDEWLNGIDEFAVMVGIYSRWVVKAGRKDGRRKADVLEENEDSNHIWSRLVICFSESHLGLLGLIKEFKTDPGSAAFVGVNDQIELVLRTLGVRARPEPFDARVAFDVPDHDGAFDLLLIQLPGASLGRIVEEMEQRLGIAREHTVSFIKAFKSFKEREQLFPVHPYLLELAKMMPHFLLMGLVALIWHNLESGGLPVLPYLKELTTELALDWQHSSYWALPLLLGFALSAAAHYLEEYRYRWRTSSPASPQMALDATVTSLFTRESQAATPTLRRGRWWNPLGYQRAGWILRAVGMVGLAFTLFQSEPPTFATFMFVKGAVAVILMVEAAATLVPLAVSRFSMWLEDHVAGNRKASAFARFVNQLNLVPTRPASLLGLSIKYHFQPSVPTGGRLAMFQAASFYVIFNAVFFAVGSYMYKQALEVWFQETYYRGWNLGLVLGGLLFWNTMYLLRFGLFVLFASVSSALSLHPYKTLGGLAALSCLVLQLLDNPVGRFVGNQSTITFGFLVAGLALMAFESEVLAWLRHLPLCRRRAAKRQTREARLLEQFRDGVNRALGIVYMSGEDLSFHKLTPELLMSRVTVLRDQLDSAGIRLLSRMHSIPDDPTLSRWFAHLYELERQHDVTLWHPMQLVIAGEPTPLRSGSGLNLVVEDAGTREQVLTAWHIRRWLVTMMSTAGHAQDTGVNLVDMALRLAQEGLSVRCVFYLIQNKYDNSDRNRPSQLPYDRGELGQRNKLARLIMDVAPGSRAYSINDWTPFGFKAGGMVGMDLVYEEALKLTNMLVLDRNANAHDLDSLLADLRLALNDPGVVIVIPGRSTTNTLTPIGQGSQLIEEGQRALTRGVMLLGGIGAESLGTGWGNIQAVYYGRVQRALCDPDTPKLPLTRPTRRGAPFGDRWEGLIGFGPHAVGISEDVWGVTQAAHTALALGYQVKFHRSRTLWHKLRESWSHAEWFSAFPRWSGGYLQMMLDPMMQRINDEGPLPVFAKEIRANGGRFFLSAPSALFSILAMPLAIIWDVSPFVQILILLWNLGFVMNQILTALGLVACLESTGFNRVTALAGAACAGIVTAFVEGLAPFAAPLVGMGFLAGGFVMGLGRWLYCRGRDIILFGPQLVIHALGQVIRQSLEFVLSGASANDSKAVNIPFRAWVGPREDRPFEGYQNFVNLRTVVWGIGLTALVLNLFALANLDFLNALLLLPSLMFSVSTLIGPFVMNPKPGRSLGRTVWLPKLLGWIASLGFYVLVAWFVARGGWLRWLGVVLFAACLGAVLRAGLKYWGYARKLNTLTNLIARRMASGGMAPLEAQNMAETIVRSLGGDVEKTRKSLEQSGLAPDQQAAVVQMVQEKLLPWLRRPVSDLVPRRSNNIRFASEWNRSFVLGLFTFLWFFIVPIPGLLVLTAPGGYRLMIPLTSVLALAGGLLALAVVGYCTSLLLERWVPFGVAGAGLTGRIESTYGQFQSLAREPDRMTAAQTASLYALFTDLQTYVDQRAYAYAQRTLALIEQTLASRGR